AHMGKVRPAPRICNLSRRRPEVNLAELNLRHIETDLSDNRSRAAALEQVLADLREQPDRGPILLINNAGVGVFGEFAPEDIDDHRKLVEVNISAVLAVTAALLPLLRERGGAIVNLA